MTEFLQHLVNGISLGTIYAHIALGYTMVYGVLKLINFAHGDVYMVGAFAGYYVATALGVQREPTLGKAVLVFLGAMVATGLLGFLIERLAYRPLRARHALGAAHAEGVRQVVPGEGAHHVDVAVREVDELQDAVDHRVAQRDEGVDGPEREPVDEVLEELGHGAVGPTLTSSRRVRSSPPTSARCP